MRLGVIVAGGVVLALAGAEVAARTFGFGHPLLYQAAAAGYELVPNQKVTRLGHTTSINNIGTRGPDVALQQAPGTVRVLVLGDSVANGGSMLDDEQVFAQAASDRLKSADCPNEILNASAGGWSLYDQIEWVKQHGTYGAQTLVWTINYMDLDQKQNDASAIDVHPSLPSRNPPSALGEIIVRYALPRLGLAPSAADSGSSGAGTFNEAEGRRVASAIREFRSFLAERHVNLVVLYHQGREPQSPEREKFTNHLAHEFSTAGVPFHRLDLFKRNNGEKYFIDGIHPNSRGHQVIAEILAKQLLPLCKKL